MRLAPSYLTEAVEVTLVAFCSNSAGDVWLCCSSSGGVSTEAIEGTAGEPEVRDRFNVQNHL